MKAGTVIGKIIDKFIALTIKDGSATFVVKTSKKERFIVIMGENSFYFPINKSIEEVASVFGQLICDKFVDTGVCATLRAKETTKNICSIEFISEPRIFVA